MIPRAASDHFDEQERLSDVTVRGVRRIWRLLRGRRWETAWRSTVGPQITEVIVAGQEASAATASAYVGSVLSEVNIDPTAPTRLLPQVFAGVTGAGNPIETATYGAVIEAAKAQYSPKYAEAALADIERQVLADAEEYLAGIVATIMADTARAAEEAALAQRPWVTGYVRMIEPGACSRCVILAGRFYLFNEGFKRHDRCRCVHIPASEDISDSMLTNPSRYFDSLTTAEQDRVFTNAGAEAIRLGANPSEVVNARRGMRTAQQNPRGWIPQGRLVPVDVNGRPTYITTEGVTRRGTFGRINTARRASGKPALPVRLMPESIIQLGRDREDVIRLLRLYGYLE